MSNSMNSTQTSTFEPIILYGSFWVNLTHKQRTIISALWLLPHEYRRRTFKTLLPKHYWELLRTREKLEATFEHPDHNNLIYGLDKSHQYKCIFVHIPKCAGISVGQNLFGRCVAHSTITDYQIMFGEKIFKEYFKFTVVRNPWDRLVSAFHYMKAGGFDKHDADWANKHLAPFSEFDQFVNHLDTHREFLRWHMIAPQCLWLKTPNGKIPFDYIGKLESLDHDINTIRSSLNLPSDSVAKSNTSNRDRDYRLYYTNKTRRIVEDIYKKDIQLLGYKFE